MVGMPGALEDVRPAVPAKGFRDGETTGYCMEQKMVAQKIAGFIITLFVLQDPIRWVRATPMVCVYIVFDYQ